MARKLWNLAVIVSVISICVPLVCVEGFFIDLETLGISTKSDGDSSEPKVLISTPSESASEYVEIDSKTEPNKSVRLTIKELKELILGPVKKITSKPQPIPTIDELKALILGSVKEITSKPQPINIKISTEGRTKEPLVAVPPSSAPTQYPAEPSINLYKYQKNFADNYNSNSYSNSARESDNDDASYWNVRPATQEDYKSNEVTSAPSSKETESSGFFKSVFRSPTKIMNSYSKSFGRWSSKPKPRNKMKPQRRPLPDITYRRRRKNRPSNRRNRPRQRPRPQRRRQQRPSYTQASSYYAGNGGDDYVDSDFYEQDNYNNYRQSNSRPSNYGDQWDRASHLRNDDFDSTMPYDDVPEEMMPPRGASPGGGGFY